MSTVKILHCADIHIGASETFLGALAQSRQRETLLTFEHILDLCAQKEIQVLCIAGDLFDSNSAAKQFGDAVLDKIASVPQLKVVYAAGNHDPLNPASPLFKANLPENLYVLSTEETVFTFEDLNLRVFGRSFETPFMKGISKPSIIPEDDGIINLLVQHGELKSDLESQYNSITKEFILSSKMDYIALGHIHKRTEIGKLSDTYFSYCGCPEGQGFDELGEKGVYLGEIGKGFCNMEFVPTAKRMHIHEIIDITNIEKDKFFDAIIEKLKENYGENFGDNLYKIELIGNIDPETVVDIADLSARIGEKVYFAKVKNSTKPLLDLEIIATEKSLRGIFVSKMLERISSADDTEKVKLTAALELGLKAFSTEVKFDEN